MAGDASLTKAVDTAWAVYRATRSGVDDADGLAACSSVICTRGGSAWQRRRRVDRLRNSFPRAASRTRMLRWIEAVVCRVAAGSARPDWTLLAISYAISAAVVISLHSVFN